MGKGLVGLVVGVALVAAAPSASAAGPVAPAAAASVPSYAVVDLGLLAGDDFSVPFGLNSAGSVVGYSGALNQMPVPFIWTAAGGIRALPLPPGTPTGQAEAINDAGQVAGHIQPSPGKDQAVRWSATGSVQLLGTLDGPASSSAGMGINSAGDVAGTSDAAPGEFEGQEAFLYTDAAGIVSVSPGARPALGYDVNDKRQVTGSDEFDAAVWSNGRTVDISGTLSGITTGEAINASGQVAVTRTEPDANSAFRWTPGAGIQSLGLDPTDEPTTAHGINLAGDVVGRGRPATSDNVMGGYVFTDSTGSLDLNDVLAPAFRDWYISEAWDINDAGQIVAEAQSLTDFSVQHAVRLDPITAQTCVSGCLRVSSIALGARTTSPTSVVVATRIVIRDERQAAVPGATVTINWTTPRGTAVVSAVTDATGAVHLATRGTHGTYRVTVTGVVKAPSLFDAEHSAVLTRTITA